MTFTRVGIIVAITAVVVYFGLNLLFPRNHVEQQAAGGVTPDQVFGGNNTSATPAAETPVAAASTPSADQQAAAEQQARSAEPAAAPATPPADAGSSAASGSSSSSAAAAAPAAAPTPPPPAPPAEQAAAAPAPAAAAPAPAPAEAAPAAEPAPAPAEAAAKPSAPAHSKAAATDIPPKAGSKVQSTDAISVWWPAVSQQKDSQLNLQYAGEAAFEKAAVLLFSDNMGKADGAAAHIKILNDHGKPAAGHWEVSPQNARMLIFKTKPGRYIIILDPALAGLSGKTLGTGLHGPVYVH